MSNTARRKGHDFERYIAKMLRKYYPNAATSRYESKSLDDASVDIANVPFFIQCKSGYIKSRPKYELLLIDIANKTQKYNIPYPKWILHKLVGKLPTIAVTTEEEFFNYVEQYQKIDIVKQQFEKAMLDNRSITVENIRILYERLFR